MRYVLIEQSIRFAICMISDIGCAHVLWTVLVHWYHLYVVGEVDQKHWGYELHCLILSYTDSNFLCISLMFVLLKYTDTL